MQRKVTGTPWEVCLRRVLQHCYSSKYSSYVLIHPFIQSSRASTLCSVLCQAPKTWERREAVFSQTHTKKHTLVGGRRCQNYNNIWLKKKDWRGEHQELFPPLPLCSLQVPFRVTWTPRVGPPTTPLWLPSSVPAPPFLLLVPCSHILEASLPINLRLLSQGDVEKL